RHAVNMSPVDAGKLGSLRGYLDVAYRLGMLLAQMDRAPARACRLQYRGEVAGKDTKLLTSAFSAGLLTQALEQDTNLVNSEILMRERGIELVEESRTDTGAFSSAMIAELFTESATYKAAGTVLGRQMPRLVQLGEY